jgi:hypothetical protein
MFNQNRLSGQLPVVSFTGSIRRRAVLLLLVISCCAPVAVFAADPGIFQLEDAHTWRTDEGDYLGAQFEIHLSSGAEEAVKNGIPLTFEIQVQVIKKNTWLWDSVEIELVRYKRLQYHALSESYQVKDLFAGSQGNYRRLGDALRAVGNIQSLLLSDETLDSELNYEIRLRGSLDIESLPTPVRLIAYVSSVWDMTSKWYSWPLVR